MKWKPPLVVSLLPGILKTGMQMPVKFQERHAAGSTSSEPARQKIKTAGHQGPAAKSGLI